MSDSDSFIREVTEEVRQDRLIGYWRRYGPYVVAGVLLIVGAAAALAWMEQRERQRSEARGAAFLSAGEGPAAHEALVGELEGSAAQLALLRLAAAQAAEGETAAAAGTYARVAGAEDLPAAYRDFAALQAIRLEAPGLAPAEAAERLAPLAEGDGPYRLLALELRAVLRLNAGETDAARADLETILASEALPEGLRARAGQLLAIVGEGDDAAG